MPTYKYESKNAAGKVSSGVVNAPNLASASQQLRARGEFILALQPADADGRGKGGFNLSLGPGISLRAAIEGISEQATNPKFKGMLIQMKKDVESGKQFSDALMRYPKNFRALYVNMVKASELSGGFAK